MSHYHPAVRAGPILSIGGWGLFATCSWTWCIGLYLPLILVREFGWPGFLLMAAPNVLGAAAFGYVWRAGAGPGLDERHRAACLWFSTIAIAFNACFVSYIAGHVWVDPIRPAAAGSTLVAAAIAASLVPGRAWPALAASVFALSLATLVAIGPAPLSTISALGPRAASGLLWLAPVIAFGFILCPHLDLTFYRARREARSPHAFAVLAVAFPLMLVLSLLYRDRLDRLALVPAAHIAAQTLFTAAAHFRELRRAAGPSSRRLVLAVAAGVGAALLPAGADAGDGEAIYLRFLVFFGLVFPAYVLLFAGPGPVLPTSRGNLAAFALVMIACLPFYELGFVGRRFWLLAFPAGFLLAWKLGRVAARIRSREAGRTPAG